MSLTTGIRKSFESTVSGLSALQGARKVLKDPGELGAVNAGTSFRHLIIERKAISHAHFRPGTESSAD